MHDEMTVAVRAMNPGRPDEFRRVFFACPMGHDLGSVPLDRLERPGGSRVDPVCQHYAHRSATR